MKNKFICLPQFDFGAFFYLIHLLLRKFVPSYGGTIFRNYLADFLALIVVMPIIVNFQIFLNSRKLFFVTKKEVLGYSCLYCIVFEIISPFILNRGTSCLVDGVAYFLGGLILYFSQYITGELKR